MLNEPFEKTSHHLLLQAGVSQSLHILKVACGTGEMACWMAEKIRPFAQILLLDLAVKKGLDLILVRKFIIIYINHVDAKKTRNKHGKFTKSRYQ